MLTTNREFFYPGIVTTQIDLYTPAFNAVSKTVTNLAGHTPAQIGDTLQYELTFTNTGADFADNSVVTDVLAAEPDVRARARSRSPPAPAASTTATRPTPPATTSASTSPRRAPCASASARARPRRRAARSRPNATVTLRFRATLEPAVGRHDGRTTTPTSPTGRARSPRTSRSPATSSARRSAALADLAITKSSSPTSVDRRAARCSTRSTVTNNGPNGGDGRLASSTRCPTGLTFVSAAGPPGTSCSAQRSGRHLRRRDDGQRRLADVHDHRHRAGGHHGDVGRSTAPGCRRRPPTTSRQTTRRRRPRRSPARPTSSPPRPGRPARVNAGAQVTYTISATNNGPSTATTVRLTDAIPVGTTLVSRHADRHARLRPARRTAAASCAPSPRSPPGRRSPANVVLAVGSGFTAADAGQHGVGRRRRSPTRTTANNTASVTTTIARSADLAARPRRSRRHGDRRHRRDLHPRRDERRAVRRPGGHRQRPGRHRADADVGGVEPRHVHDHGRRVSCAIGLLSPGSSATITVQATVASTVAGASIVNTASASSTTPDPTPANNSADGHVDT